MKRGELRMLKHLLALGDWYTPELSSRRDACIALQRSGYLERRQLPVGVFQAKFEYRINPPATILHEAKALGIL